MRVRLGKWWPVGKGLLALAILSAIGWRFASDLRSPALWQRPVHPAWLVLSGMLYILGMGFWAFFWYRLLRVLGQRPTVLTAVRAYYVGLLGKYLPGKAWALLLRAGLGRGPGVRLGVAGFTAFYEVLTTMTAGVLVGMALFAVCLPDTSPTTSWPILRVLFDKNAPANLYPGRNSLIFLAGILLALVGTPLWPGIFNRIAERLTALKRMVTRDAETSGASSWPRIPYSSLGQGLVVTACGWLLWGTSLWAVLQAVQSEPQPWEWRTWGLYTASLALAYVAGFIIVVVPSGFGVREALLTLFLAPVLSHMPGTGATKARATALLAVLLLRLVWTAAEAVIAGVLYWMPHYFAQERSRDFGRRARLQ